MKPLSETELREKIDDYVDRFRMQWVVEGDEYHQSELIEDIVQLIIQDRKAWGEQVIGEDERIDIQSEFDKIDVPHLETDKYPGLDGVRQASRNLLRAVQRQRNQGEKK